jgi:hypothetical protein
MKSGHRDGESNAVEQSWGVEPQGAVVRLWLMYVAVDVQSAHGSSHPSIPRVYPPIINNPSHNLIILIRFVSHIIDNLYMKVRR